MTLKSVFCYIKTFTLHISHIFYAQIIANLYNNGAA